MKPDIIFGREELLIIIDEIAFISGYISGMADVIKLLGVSKMDSETLSSRIQEQHEKLQQILLKLNTKYLSEKETS